MLLALLLGLLLAPSARAASSVTVTYDQPDPSVGEVITFSVTAISDCSQTYTFSVDGVDLQTKVGGSTTFTHTFTTPGDHTVAVRGVDFDCASDTTATDTEIVPVSAQLGGTIATSPAPPRPNEPAALAVVGSGGTAPYAYAWDSDDDGAFDDGTTRTVYRTFPAVGTYTVRVRLRDAAVPLHEAVVTKTITVEVPPAPEPGAPPPPPPPPCTKTLTFALSELTTAGCWTRVASPTEQYETTDRVTLNGFTFSDLGQRFVVSMPTTAEPGGHIASPNAAIEIDALIPYTGPVDWTLPAGVQGEEATLQTVTVPSFAELFRLGVGGSALIRLGWGADGRRYSTFGLNVELPSVFQPAPNTASVGVTGAVSLRVDDRGPQYDGLKINLTDVWIGRIKVPEACFSYVPANGQAIAPCTTPTLDDQPYLTCQDDTGTARWDANAILELPVEAKVRHAVFGGLVDGRLSKFGGFSDNISALGVQLVPGVLLNRFGAGVCLEPAPLKLRGDAGIEALGGKLVVNGRFTYTDPFQFQPWSVDVGGNATFGGLSLGDGNVRFTAWGDIDFGLRTDINLFDVASVKGQAAGWVEARSNRFNVSGTLDACIASVICGKALGLLSSTGVAGCIDAGEIVIYEPVNPRQGPFGFGSISFSTVRRVYPIKAGFGHRYGEGVDLLGNSCNFAPYSAIRSRSALVARTGIVQRIAPGTKAIALRIHGTDGPPKVVVRGPKGTTITSPANARGEERKGKYLLAENETDGTTSVLLVKPAAGRWTIKAAPGAKSSPTRADRSAFEAPSTLFGQIRAKGGRQQLALGYAVPKGATVRLVERGKGIGRTISGAVRGKPCRGATKVPGGGRLRCFRTAFEPSRGPGGARTVQAIVTRGGIPLLRKTVAKFRVAKETLPSRPGALRARRVDGDVVVAFPQSRGASRYSVTAVLDDGRRLGFDLPRKCRAVRIPDVPAGVKAIVKVAGLRYDLLAGKTRRIALLADRESAGRSGRLPRRVCS